MVQTLPTAFLKYLNLKNMTSQEISKYLSYLSMWGIAIPVIIGFIYWRNLDIALRILLLYLTLLLLGTIIGFVCLYYNINNIWLFSILMGIEAFFVAWFYSKVLNPIKLRPIVLVIGLLLNLYIIVDTMYLNQSFLKSIAGNSSAVILAFSCLWAIIFIYQIITNPKSQNLTKNPYFIIASAWLFGAMLSLFLVIYANALWYYSKNLYLAVTNITNFLTGIQYLLFAYAFYLKKRKLESFKF